MYRFGLIGYGAMGNYHAQQIGTMPDFAVSAVYDIAPEKREKARAEGRDVCDSLEELLMCRITFTSRSLSRQCTRASTFCAKNR